MKDKLDELKDPHTDVTSTESQEFLQKLHKELIELNDNFRKELAKYGVIFDSI